MRRTLLEVRSKVAEGYSARCGTSTKRWQRLIVAALTNSTLQP